jgi:predicted nucleotidyltransferase
MKSQIIHFLQTQLPQVKGIYLFGSRLTAEYVRADSDWDVGFLLDARPMDTLEKWNLQQQMGTALNAEIDLIDLQAANTVFRFEIITTGKRIFCADDYFCDYFEMMTYSFYQKLQEERKEIITDILKRGSVYG